MRVIKAYRNASDDILLRSKAKPYDLRNKDEVNKAYHHHNQLLHHCLTFLKGKAIGLAGPQLGINRRIFAMETRKGTWKVCVNPEIDEYKGKAIRKGESCLSIPKHQYETRRAESLEVSYIKLQSWAPGSQEYITEFAYLTGQEAIIFQHEYDHLEGLLIDEQRKYNEKY